MSLKDFLKYQPVYAPDAELGVDTGVEGGEAPPPPPPANEAPVDGPGSGRSKLRGQLEKATEQSRKAAPKDDKKYQSRARQEQEPAEGEEPVEGQEPQQEPVVKEGQQKQAAPQTAAPEAWSKEAKAEWAKLPPTVQAAIAKRETDTTAGVEQLKKNYADIDAAIKPRMEAIQRLGHTPAAAVNQLFLWMEALTRDAANLKSGRAAEAFPALARSYGIDPVALLKQMIGQGQQPQQQQQPAQQGQPDLNGVPPAVQQYISSIERKLGEFQTGVTKQIGDLTTTFAQQSMAKTNEMLNNWAKDKPYYNEARVLMARFMTPGPNGEPPAVPPMANGEADLDRAYDMAVWASSDIRAKIEADRVKADEDKRLAEAKAQKDQAAKARRAQGGSLQLGAPGTPASSQQKPAKKGKTVRESLTETIAQMNEA